MSSFDNHDEESVEFSFAPPPRREPQAPGQVRFDDRGNAIYEWSDARLEQDGSHAERLRANALSYAGLAVVDAEPAATDLTIQNDKGLRMGYNPYESGLLTSKQPPRKHRDMRELSKWIEMKRKLEQLKK